MEDKNIKIFLVEDDATIRDLYEQAFIMKGYHIEAAVDGQDAVDKLEKMEVLPALILLDILMPRMGGFNVLQYMKNSDKLKNILVVILTSVGEEEAVQKALDLGAADYLIKSDVELHDVAAKVEEVINGSQK